MVIVFTLFTSLLYLQNSTEVPSEISAKHWFNPHTIQIPDERTYMVLFFSTVQGESDTRRYVTQLEKLRNKRGIVVMGLSAESPKRVEKYIKEKRIRFLVGAESKAYKHFRIKKFPALVVLNPKHREVGEGSEVINFNDLEEYIRFPDSEDSTPLVSAEFDAESSIEVLQQHARQDSDNNEKKKAIVMLRKRMNPQHFMNFCDDLLATTDHMALRGHLAYQKHLADPSIADKEPYLAPGIVAGQARRKNPDAPEWSRVKDYEEIVDELSQEQLVADFFDNQVDASDQQSLLIRREIGYRFNSIADIGSPVEKAMARDLLMQMLPAEPRRGGSIVASGCTVVYGLSRRYGSGRFPGAATQDRIQYPFGTSNDGNGTPLHENWRRSLRYRVTYTSAQ